MKPTVIALTGRPGAGKDTIADMLAPALGFQRIAFADALRREIAEAWRLPVAMLTDRPTKEWPLPALAIGMCSDTGFMSWCHEQGESLSDPRSPRWVMQNWGDYKRRFNPGHYADIVARWAQKMIGTGWTRLVITDLRYPVEAQALERFDAQIIRVVRPESTAMSADTAAHSSERYELIKPHYQIDNKFDIPQLAWNTLQVLERLGCVVPRWSWDPKDWSKTPVVEGGAA